MKQNLFNFWKNRKLTPEEQNDLLVETFRKVFGTPEGKIVLNALLTDLHLYEATRTKRDHFLNEYAKFFIRRRMGVGDTVALTDFIAETAAGGGGA
jgi:hypothetical protein